MPGRPTKQARDRAPLRYREVADVLLREIADARHPVGNMLPAEIELCKRFGVSRYTVREALRRLEDLGVIKRRQGSGTIVRARHPEVRYTQQLNTVGELLQYPPDTSLHVVEARNIVADRALAERLDCAPRKRWHRISCVRRGADGTPLCWVDVYVSPKHSAISSLIGSEPLSVYALLDRLYGLRPRRVTVQLFAEPIAAAHASQLAVEPDTPGLTIVRRYVGPDERCFEVSIGQHPAGRFTYSMELEQEWEPG